MVVNAVDYDDVKVFVTALIEAIQAGKQLIFRSAAALTKVLGGIEDRALLTRHDLIQEQSPRWSHYDWFSCERRQQIN
ncbi:hypothetical protein ACEQPO_29080 [Bacillus sp. SL00103]